MNISCTVSKQGDLAKSLSRTRLVRACVPASRNYAKNVATMMVMRGQEGHTSRNLRGYVEEVSGGVEVGIVGPPALHWVQFGRGPGKPPPYGIMERWALRHDFLIKGAGAEGAKTQMIFAIQRAIQVKRTAAAATTVKSLMAGRVDQRRLSVAEARGIVRQGIHPMSAPPPLAAIAFWMEKNGIRPTYADVLRTWTNNIRFAIAKRGTRRFRQEVPNPVRMGIEGEHSDALRSIMGRWLV